MSKETFRSSLRAAVRAHWAGVLNRREFRDSFESSLDKYLREAWNVGGAHYGITQEDYTQRELNQRDRFILEQIKLADGFAEDIAKNAKAKGGALESLLSRVDLWANRYDELSNIARVMAAEDSPLRWMLGKTDKHCVSCSSLRDWVKRASYWDDFYKETGLRPQSEKLACNGYHCACRLSPTRMQISKGRPPVIV